LGLCHIVKKGRGEALPPYTAIFRGKTELNFFKFGLVQFQIAVPTLAEERNISFKKAQAIQAKAIAYNIKGKKKK